MTYEERDQLKARLNRKGAKFEITSIERVERYVKGIGGGHWIHRYEITTPDGRHYGLRFNCNTTYISHKNSRLRNTGKTRYSVSAEMCDLDAIYNPQGQQCGMWFDLKAKSFVGETRVNGEKVDAQKALVERWAASVFGIESVRWDY